MLKKFLSARFSVPGVSAPTIWSNSFCSLVAYEPSAAARMRRLPQPVKVTSRACG
jgi:hypothetical protein